jgi:hypothetical protein
VIYNINGNTVKSLHRNGRACLAFVFFAIFASVVPLHP